MHSVLVFYSTLGKKIQSKEVIESLTLPRQHRPQLQFQIAIGITFRLLCVFLKFSQPSRYLLFTLSCISVYHSAKQKKEKKCQKILIGEPDLVCFFLETLMTHGLVQPVNHKLWYTHFYWPPPCLLIMLVPCLCVMKGPPQFYRGRILMLPPGFSCMISHYRS